LFPSGKFSVVVVLRWFVIDVVLAHSGGGYEADSRIAGCFVGKRIEGKKGEFKADWGPAFVIRRFGFKEGDITHRANC